MNDEPSRAAIDRMIASIDDRIGRVVDSILHHPEFQQLEAAWRGLWHVVDRAAFDQNIQVHLWNCSKQELQDDLEDAAEVTTSRFFRTVYSSEFGQFGGQPYSAVFATFAVDASPPDVALVRRMASVAAMAHAPVLFAAHPRLFNLRHFSELTSATNVPAIFEDPAHIGWNALRQGDDSRYVGILLPRMLLRLPYGEARESAESFVYEERALQADDYLWGSPVFAFAVRLGQSFARYRTALGMLGPAGDEPPVRDRYTTLGPDHEKPSVEVVLSRRMEATLSDLGFIPLMCEPHRSALFFMTAASIQLPRSFPRDEQAADGTDPTVNFLLGTHLPYLLLAARFAHYLKVIERERIGGHRTRDETERELNQWLSEFVNHMDMVGPATRSKYPLRRGRVKTSDVDGAPGWYRMEVLIQPHLRHMEHPFQLSVTGRIDAR